MSEQNVKPSQRDPLEFLNRARSVNKKRTINERRADFDEIYVEKPSDELSEQASRCLDCGNPYCEWKCPLHNYIPNWLELVRKEQFDQAAKLMHETNPLPEICGRVCPQDRLCEKACTLNTGFGAVTIGAIEKNISDRALAKKWRPDLSNLEMSDKKVAIVGAGPAGLGCAELLARNGVKPVVFDKYPEIGGLLTFGIPGFKLEKEVVRKRREFLEDIGVEFRLNTEVGKQVSVQSLKDDYDSLFLAMGCYKSVTGNLPGGETEGVIKALDFLVANVNLQQNYQMTGYPFQSMQGKKVVVLGGGDTAMDCVRSAIRQDAESVTCVYRRDKKSMPGSPQEVKNATEEGVQFLYNRQPLSIEEKNGQVCGVKLAETELQRDFSNDRSNFVVNQDKTSLLEADVVILAFGFQASPASWFDDIGVTQKSNGLVITQSTNDPDLPYLQHTESEGIFAGGDMVRGADLVVTAIAEGRQAAREILDYLNV
ncbi:FAD-dependent oxidoreductase [Aliikangiella coralliicola]|uniref:Glutamate synthase small subunit n=1 Tax=Aliikangiella coralliicola TaxID=2592383 RepID=A0A545UA87_9GAMM|nr:FAD-dependent oxidoreductase [Aliikangiella coralliicola]TQV86382.1 glutamate synthase small subunit [Aliikangiella coralliicola]